jgi:DNA-binding Lrp family transcriptional regulator
MMTAFILIETQVGTSPTVVAKLKATPEIKTAHRVMGLFDVIVMAEVADVDYLGKFINDKVHKLPGVTRTATCIAVNG